MKDINLKDTETIKAIVNSIQIIASSMRFSEIGKSLPSWRKLELEDIVKDMKNIIKDIDNIYKEHEDIENE